VAGSLFGLLLISMVGAFLLWPQRVILRYRKTWIGPLGWMGCWHLPAGQMLWIDRLGWRWRWGSLQMQGRWPPRVRGHCSPIDWLRYWPYLLAIGNQIHLTSWQGEVEIGFTDPAVTGQCLGLIAALPPPLAHHIRLTFTRVGWHGQGSLLLQFRCWRMLGPGLTLGWRVWQSSYQLRKRR
jgi:hypothetical protein